MTALNIDTGVDATTMAAEILGGGFTIDSAIYFGAAASSGVYSDGDTSNPGVLPSDTGVILSTGNAEDFGNATGANNQAGGTSTDTIGPNNVAEFNTAAGQGTNDASYLEIDFTPLAGQTMLTLEFRFYSEEYNEYVYSDFNDIALIQVDGVTIPISAGSGEISVNSINDAENSNPANGDQANDPNPGNGVFDSSNPNLYIDNTAGTFDTEFDGFTVTLSVDIPVTPGVQQTLFIGVADVGDSSFDSSLVIASNSDVQGVDPIAQDDLGIETFGANPKTVDVLANDSDPDSPTLTITQINGVDVVANDTVTLNTGQEVTLNANGTITLVNVGGNTGETSFSYTVSDDDGNTDSAFVTFDAAPICFAEGTPIATPFGARQVEDLVPGDLVLTRDEGAQPIRWIGRRKMWSGPEHAPVRIMEGAFGNASTLRVSPQHRLLISGYRVQLHVGADEVLVAAAGLIDGDMVVQEQAGWVTYHHLLLDRHHVIYAAGMPCESYQPGAFSLPGLDARARDELFVIFPELRANPLAYGPSARSSVSSKIATVLVG